MHTITGKTIIILGGGVGGLVAANKLRKSAGKNARIILIDKSASHIYAPSFLLLMLGKRQAKKIQKPLSLLRRKGIEFLNDEVLAIDPERKIVQTRTQALNYDYLIIALGAKCVPEKIPGLAQSGYNLYDLKETERLQNALKSFSGGKVTLVISSLPFTCPAAPYEAAFLLDEFFRKKGIRDKTQISIFTPETLPMPAAGPENGKAIKAMLDARSINFQPELRLASVDSEKKLLAFEGGRASEFDLLIFVPPHQGSKVASDSGIGNELGWIPVDAKTLKTNYGNVFAIGDVITIILPSGKLLPKAGVFAHFEAEVVAENIASEIRGLPPKKVYDGYASCFLEIGYGKAGFASGNFYAEPVPKVKLHKPARIWHWSKMLFEKYWFWKWF